MFKILKKRLDFNGRKISPYERQSFKYQLIYIGMQFQFSTDEKPFYTPIKQKCNAIRDLARPKMTKDYVE